MLLRGTSAAVRPSSPREFALLLWVFPTICGWRGPVPGACVSKHSVLCSGLFTTYLLSLSGVPRMLFTPASPAPDKEKVEFCLTLRCDLPGSCPLDVVKSASRQLQGNLL